MTEMTFRWFRKPTKRKPTPPPEPVYPGNGEFTGEVRASPFRDGSHYRQFIQWNGSKWQPFTILDAPYLATEDE